MNVYLFHKYLLSAYYGQRLDGCKNDEKYSHISALIKCLEMNHVAPPTKWQISSNKTLIPLSFVTVWIYLQKGSY